MENKKVTFDERYDELDRVNEELAEYSEELGIESSLPVRITTTSTRTSGLKAQVNWAAFGDATPETAVAISKLLVKAAKLAENFKYNGYEVVFR